MNEATACMIFTTAIREGRAAELFTALLNGGSGTVDHLGRLVIIEASIVELFESL